MTTADRIKYGAQRDLADGCIGCNESELACDAAIYTTGRPCCPFCQGHGPL